MKAFRIWSVYFYLKNHSCLVVQNIKVIVIQSYMFNKMLFKRKSKTWVWISYLLLKCISSQIQRFPKYKNLSIPISLFKKPTCLGTSVAVSFMGKLTFFKYICWLKCTWLNFLLPFISTMIKLEAPNQVLNGTWKHVNILDRFFSPTQQRGGPQDIWSQTAVG